MSTKKKGAEEQLVERNRDLDRLKMRIEELEKELSAYKAKEAEIASAMTLAAQSRANIIAEAEKVAGAMTHNADKQAQTKIDEANTEAARIIAEAQKEADKILAKAQADADDLTRSAEKTTKEIVSIAFENSKKMNDHTQAINETLVRAATDLYSYITAYRDDYEKVTGKKAEGIPDIAKKTVPEPTEPAKSAEITPEDYQTPEELYHTVLKLSGRDPESNIPETVPLSSDMLDLGNTEDNISEIVNAEITKEQAEPEQPKEDPKVKELPKEEQTEQNDAAEEKTEQDNLEEMLSAFMSSIDEEPAKEHHPEQTEEAAADNLDNILGAITEEQDKETPLSPETDELTKILNELFGEEKKSSAE